MRIYSVLIPTLWSIVRLYNLDAREQNLRRMKHEWNMKVKEEVVKQLGILEVTDTQVLGQYTASA